MRKLIIFDVDGTLVDSQDFIVGAMIRAFEGEGLVPPAREAALSIVGLSLPQAIAELAPELPKPRQMQLVTAYKAAFLKMREAGGAEAQAQLYPGAREVLDGFRAAGFLMALATGKARRGVDHFVQSHGFEGMFDAIQTADDAPSKPHPQMVLNCLSQTGIDAVDAVLIGDTEFDMAMGRAAGVRTIGVRWGYHPDERVLRGGAEAMADHCANLPPIVKGLWEAA